MTYDGKQRKDRRHCSGEKVYKSFIYTSLTFPLVQSRTVLLTRLACLWVPFPDLQMSFSDGPVLDRGNENFTPNTSNVAAWSVGLRFILWRWVAGSNFSDTKTWHLKMMFYYCSCTGAIWGWQHTRVPKPIHMTMQAPTFNNNNYKNQNVIWLIWENVHASHCNIASFAGLSSTLFPPPAHFNLLPVTS